MSEFIKTAEVIGNVAEKIYNAGRFVVKQFRVESWSQLPGDPTPMVRPANISYYETGEEDELTEVQ